MVKSWHKLVETQTSIHPWLQWGKYIAHICPHLIFLSFFLCDTSNTIYLILYKTTCSLIFFNKNTDIWTLNRKHFSNTQSVTLNIMLQYKVHNKIYQIQSLLNIARAWIMGKWEVSVLLELLLLFKTNRMNSRNPPIHDPLLTAALFIRITVLIVIRSKWNQISNMQNNSSFSLLT